MSEQENILTIGPKSFMPENALEYKYRYITILYDQHFDSCKIKIDGKKFKKTIPTQGGVSPPQLVIVTDTLAAILDEFAEVELAKEILGAFSRFMISKPRLEAKVRFK